MLDHGKKWPEPPDWTTARVSIEGLTITSITGMSQFYVSGNLDGFRAIHGLATPHGLLGLATGRRFAVRMARDRMLVVGIGDDELVTGWHNAGYGVTRMSSALHVFEIAGPLARDLIARGCVFDDRDPGPCSTIQFAGVTVSLYSHGDADILRLHVDRGLASYLWSWIDAQKLVHPVSTVAGR